MTTPILATKLYIPRLRSAIVHRERLLHLLNQGMRRKLTLVSAPAGFGKSTLLSEWVTTIENPTAWLSLDHADNDPARFLTYLVAAIQTILPAVGQSTLEVLQSPQPPSLDYLLTSLINDIAAIDRPMQIVLDDYHMIQSTEVDDILNFLLDYQPPTVHLVIATREDPQLPLARLRARQQVTEVRVVDLRFTNEEAASFLNQVMGLPLSAEDVAALDTRTEGWIVGLQLAALSMQRQADMQSFIDTFTGSHHFVLDYLMEEVLQHQPAHVQQFLLYTSILERLSGTLCDAVLSAPSAVGHEMLIYLHNANLFLISLDNHREWYRYHHLFADLLRQRLETSLRVNEIEALHMRASQWYEDNGLLIDAFQHAAAANDLDRAELLLQGDGVPLYFRGIFTPVLNWFESLPEETMNARPSLWVWYAFALTIGGRSLTVETKLRKAEALLSDVYDDVEMRNIHGHISAIRAMIASPNYDSDVMITEAQRALELLAPHHVAVRGTVEWARALAYQRKGRRVEAKQAYQDIIAVGAKADNKVITMAAATCLGQIQESDTQMYTAQATYLDMLEKVGDNPPPYVCEAFMGLARIHYAWNELEIAEAHAREAIRLALQMHNVDSPAEGDTWLARIALARGDVQTAQAALDRAEAFVRQNKFVQAMQVVAAAQVRYFLHLGHHESAMQTAQTIESPVSVIRVHIAQRDATAALDLLRPLLEEASANQWHDAVLNALVLQSMAYMADDATDDALHVLSTALTMAQKSGDVRLFLDEGPPMMHLLKVAAARGIAAETVRRLLHVTDHETSQSVTTPKLARAVGVQPLAEPLSERELEVLRLVANGLSNREIGERLYLALDTIKGHNRRIFGKLGVQRRTEAVARARELGLIE